MTIRYICVEDKLNEYNTTPIAIDECHHRCVLSLHKSFALNVRNNARTHHILWPVLHYGAFFLADLSETVQEELIPKTMALLHLSVPCHSSELSCVIPVNPGMRLCVWLVITGLTSVIYTSNSHSSVLVKKATKSCLYGRGLRVEQLFILLIKSILTWNVELIE